MSSKKSTLLYCTVNYCTHELQLALLTTVWNLRHTTFHKNRIHTYSYNSVDYLLLNRISGCYCPTGYWTFAYSYACTSNAIPCWYTCTNVLNSQPNSFYTCWSASCSDSQVQCSTVQLNEVTSFSLHNVISLWYQYH